MNTFDLDKQYVAGTYKRFPVEIVSGKGSLVRDVDGKEYIDMGSGIAVTSFGIADEEWIAAVEKQIHSVQHMSNLYYTAPCANLAKALSVNLDMKYGLLRYDATSVMRTRYSIESSHISRRIDTSKRIYHLDILIDNDVAVFFLNNREALSTRIYRMPGMPWGIFVCDGEACFDHLTMRLLTEE